MCGIYKIVNKKNGKYYVGSSTRIEEKRWPYHSIMLKANRHFNSHLQSAWNKYGEKSFDFIIVKKVKKSRLIEAEQKYLDVAKMEQSKCYNQTFTAGRVDWTPALRDRMSKITMKRLSNPKNHGMFGKQHSLESRKKMSKSQSGKKRSLSARLKISGENNVAHRLSVKRKKRLWWKNLKSNPIKYKNFCSQRAKKSADARKKI